LPGFEQSYISTNLLSLQKQERHAALDTLKNPPTYVESALPRQWFEVGENQQR
jgi:hypothetical protein